jgi:catechol 2,3-dioxygenase-like lactoylglutathione lyase family enzyme
MLYLFVTSLLPNFFRLALKFRVFRKNNVRNKMTTKSVNEESSGQLATTNQQDSAESLSMKIAQVTLIVRNQSKALEFYMGKLGFEKKIDFPTTAGYRWIAVGPKGQNFGLALVEAGWPDDSGLGRKWSANGAPPIVINVEDCSKTYHELKSRGVKFKRVWGEELKQVPYGTVAFFADPDGNLFEILESARKANS